MKLGDQVFKQSSDGQKVANHGNIWGRMFQLEGYAKMLRQK